MNIDKNTEEQIINFGALGYPASKIANILGYSEEHIQSLFTNKTSEFYELYQKGVDLADYVIDLKLFELAKSGDINALDKLDYRKKTRQTK